MSAGGFATGLVLLLLRFHFHLHVARVAAATAATAFMRFHVFALLHLLCVILIAGMHGAGITLATRGATRFSFRRLSSRLGGLGQADRADRDRDPGYEAERKSSNAFHFVLSFEFGLVRDIGTDTDALGPTGRQSCPAYRTKISRITGRSLD